MKVALYNALSCGGCDLIFFLEELPDDFLTKMTPVYWPELGILESPGRKKLDLAFVCGAIKTRSQEEKVRYLRQKARVLVAVGACALHGGIPGLLWEKGEGPRPVPAVVPCDLLVPGCPPEPATLRAVLRQKTKKPKKELRPLCEECSCVKQPFRMKRLVRVSGGRRGPGECLLARGIPCLGPVTRAGCGAICIRFGEPCRGCYGPLDRHSGERFLAALASGVLPVRAEEFWKEFVDPVGTLFRFYLAESPLLKLRKKVRDEVQNHKDTAP